MCYALYISINKRCDLIPWDEGNPGLHINELYSKEDFQVKDKFSKSFIYKVGSWQGCGCGFFCDTVNINDDDDREQIKKTNQCIKDLVSFLNELLEEEHEVEAFLCWEGDQNKMPKKTLCITPNNLLTDSLPLDELDFVIIKKESNK